MNQNNHMAHAVHKYTRKEFKNGRWIYYYETNRKVDKGTKKFVNTMAKSVFANSTVYGKSKDGKAVYGFSNKPYIHDGEIRRRDTANTKTSFRRTEHRKAMGARISAARSSKSAKKGKSWLQKLFGK
jgi:hypothetical protein